MIASSDTQAADGDTTDAAPTAYATLSDSELGAKQKLLEEARVSSQAAFDEKREASAVLKEKLAKLRSSETIKKCEIRELKAKLTVAKITGESVDAIESDIETLSVALKYISAGISDFKDKCASVEAERQVKLDERNACVASLAELKKELKRRKDGKQQTIVVVKKANDAPVSLPSGNKRKLSSVSSDDSAKRIKQDTEEVDVVQNGHVKDENGHVEMDSTPEIDESNVAALAKAKEEAELATAKEEAALAKAKAKEEAALAKAKAKEEAALAKEEAALAKAKAKEEAELAKAKAKEEAEIAKAKAKEEAAAAKAKAKEEAAAAKAKAKEEAELAKAKLKEEAAAAKADAMEDDQAAITVHASEDDNSSSRVSVQQDEIDESNKNTCRRANAQLNVVLARGERQALVDWTRICPLYNRIEYKLAGVDVDNVYNEVCVLGEGYQLAIWSGDLLAVLDVARRHLFYTQQLAVTNTLEQCPLTEMLLSGIMCDTLDEEAIEVDADTLRLECETMKKELSRERVRRENKKSESELSELQEKIDAKLDSVSYCSHQTPHEAVLAALGVQGCSQRRTTAASLWRNFTTISSQLRINGDHVYNVGVFKQWIACIAMCFLHPTETTNLKAPDVSLLDAALASAQQRVTVSLPDVSVQPLRVNCLPFGRHVSSNETLLYLVRTILEALFRHVVLPRLSDDASAEPALTVDSLFDIVLKRLHVESLMSTRAYMAEYNSNALRHYNVRGRDDLARCAAERAMWRQVRDELASGLRVPTCHETLRFVNMLFPYHY